MVFNTIGANAQMPVSAHEKAFIVEYEADMADAHANEYFAFVLHIEMFNTLNVR